MRLFSMPPAVWLIVVLCTTVKTATAVPPRQYYTNGVITSESAKKDSEVWDYVGSGSAPVTPPTGFDFTGPFAQCWHYFRETNSDLIFKQQYLRVYKQDPKKRIFYFNVEGGVWTGFYDPTTGQYTRLRDIAKSNDLRKINVTDSELPGDMTPLSKLGQQKTCCLQPQKTKPDDGEVVAVPPDAEFAEIEKVWSEKQGARVSSKNDGSL